MSVLVLVEHDNKNMSHVMRSVLQAALQLDETPTLLVVGYNCDSVVLEVSKLAHVYSVWHFDNASYEYHFPEQLSKLIAKIAKPFSHVIAPATTFGKNILPRCAALLDVTQVTDVTKIIDKNTFEHPIYAGNAIEVVEILDSQKVLTIRGTAFEPIIDSQNPCSVEKISDVVINSKTRFISKKCTDLVRPDLNSASIVVSGGRGLQSIEKFKLVDELADALGAAVGASRAAVDAGFAPNDCQVGQTGKIVAPSLYIALGISGAVQHLAGMKDSKVIVAINSDEDAPIFQIASYGLVGDLFSLVPEIINELKTRGIAKC